MQTPLQILLNKKINYFCSNKIFISSFWEASGGFRGCSPPTTRKNVEKNSQYFFYFRQFLEHKYFLIRFWCIFFLRFSTFWKIYSLIFFPFFFCQNVFSNTFCNWFHIIKSNKNSKYLTYWVMDYKESGSVLYWTKCLFLPLKNYQFILSHGIA